MLALYLDSDAPPELESVNGDEQVPTVLENLLDDDTREATPVPETTLQPPSPFRETTPPDPVPIPQKQSTPKESKNPSSPTSTERKRKKRYSEDIPNSLKEPEKRVSRSGRQCRGVIPFSIDNPRHYSMKKLKKLNKKTDRKSNGNDNHLKDNQSLKLSRKQVYNGNSDIEEIELDSLAEKTHQELLSVIKSEAPVKLDRNRTCQVDKPLKNLNFSFLGLR